jgi:Ankyrin repeats (3 copies)
MAGRRGDVAAMTMLLDAGADPDLREAGDTGWTPLLHAIFAGHAAAARLLLDRGANPNARGINGALPLVTAAGKNDPAFVSMLLAHGASARDDGHDGAEVLTAAIRGAAFDETDAPPVVIAFTAFQIASGGGCLRDTVHALLAHDPDLKLGASYKPAQQARLVGRWNCGDLLALVDR